MLQLSPNCGLLGKLIALPYCSFLSIFLRWSHCKRGDSSLWRSTTKIVDLQKLALRNNADALEHAYTHTHTHLKAIKIDCEWLSRYVKSISDRAAWGCLCQFSLTALELRWHMSAVSELQHTFTEPHTRARTLFPEHTCDPLSLLSSLHSPACVPQWTRMWYSQRNGLPAAQTDYVISILAQTGTETPC